MIATTNMVLLASVLASAGLFAAYDTAPRKDEAPATFSERFPRPEEMFKPVAHPGAAKQGPQVTVNPTRKGDKIVGDNKIVALGEFCAEQQWPYIAPQCLQRTDGAAVRWPTRTITIERRADGGSSLDKTPVETVALR
jgi:hypothetical protein